MANSMNTDPVPQSDPGVEWARQSQAVAANNLPLPGRNLSSVQQRFRYSSAGMPIGKATMGSSIDTSQA